MGGHGTWHLAANDPDGFAAIAPSAGWRSFDTYGGRPEGALRELWHAADAASDTEALIGNLVQVPTYILHGDADKNVPASEARAMEALLREAGAEPRAHYEEGKGHWWDAGVGPGTDCLAWPGFFELFRSSEIPEAPTEIEFTTVDPAVDSRHYWIEVLRPLVYGRPSEIHGRLDPESGVVELGLDNVEQLILHPPSRVRSVVIEEDDFEWKSSDPAGTREPLLLDAGASGLRSTSTQSFVLEWTATKGIEPHLRRHKSPEFSGPLKRGFDRGFAFVVPTGGDEEENRASLERARYEAAVWVYRANGHAPLVRDTELLGHPDAYRGRSLVLFGNADVNQAWKTVFGGEVPIRVRRGSVRLGEQEKWNSEGEWTGGEWEGEDLSALFLYPRQDDPGSLAVGLGSTGASAETVATTFATFVSGVGYPDFAVVGGDVLTKGDEGVRAAGWLDAYWRANTLNAVRR